jgi:hypothetical protein
VTPPVERAVETSADRAISPYTTPDNATCCDPQEPRASLSSLYGCLSLSPSASLARVRLYARAYVLPSLVTCDTNKTNQASAPPPTWSHIPVNQQLLPPPAHHSHSAEPPNHPPNPPHTLSPPLFINLPIRSTTSTKKHFLALSNHSDFISLIYF